MGWAFHIYQAWKNQVPCTDKRYVNTKVTANIFSVVGILLGFLHVLYIGGTCTMHGPTVINYYVVWRITIHAYGEFNCHWTRCNTEESSITLNICVCVLELSNIGRSSSGCLEGEPGKGRKVSKSARDRNMKESIISIPIHI